MNRRVLNQSWFSLFLVCFGAVTFSCSRYTPPASERIPPESFVPAYDLRVDLDPKTHSLEGVAGITIPAAETVRFHLAPNLEILRVDARGAELRSGPYREEGFGEDEGSWTIDWRPEVATPELIVAWKGQLYQDPSAGELPGEIHNRKMNRTIGEEGVYLTGAWYPVVSTELRSEYSLSVNRPDNMVIVANGAKAPSDGSGRDLWNSHYPVGGIVLVGGDHEIHRDSWNGIDIELHLKPSQAVQAEGLTNAVKTYLDRYQPLLGPLPTTQYRVVDNFFSSGFAFPGFTLLSSAVIDMGKRSQTTHGYIDHEFVHSWFGNAVQVDHKGGNWCEALTSHCTNHYGHVLDGYEDGARTYRRNAMHFFSRIGEDGDKPLSTFGRKDGAGRTIGYNKGAVVFYMLAQEMGTDEFFQALRTMTYRDTGKAVSWERIEEHMENSAGRPMDWFFDQWVYSAGAPDLNAESAHWNASENEVVVELREVSEFRTDVPVRMTYQDRSETVVSRLDTGSDRIRLANIVNPPSSVVLDPDYDVFRRIDPEDLIPTTNSTRKGERLFVIGNPHEAETFSPYVSIFERSYDEEHIVRIEDLDKPIDDWDNAAVLIVGSAVTGIAARSVLGETDSRLVFSEKGFILDETEYSSDAHSVLATMRHPRLPGCGVTVVTGNSKKSLPRAMNIPFYPNSIVVFENGTPIHRLDLEAVHEIPVIRLE